MHFKERTIMFFIVVLLAGSGFVVLTKPQFFLSATKQANTRYALTLPSDQPLPLALPSSKKRSNIEIVAQDLKIPWEIAWLPEGQMLVTERAGRLLIIKDNLDVIPIPGVAHVGEGGLLGLAIHPQFRDNQWIYLYLTTEADERLINRVARYRLIDNRLTDGQVIIDNIPGARFHDGGRIKFGPDGLLYITVGDAGNEDQAQNPDSLNGTILRLHDDGTIPADNPFGTAVYSYGHRNPQGLAWDNNGRLWITEHGRSGIKSGLDEINLIIAGENYGWPVIEGDQQNIDMKSPIIHSGPDIVWAPAGAAWHQSSIFFAGLRGESLYQAKVSGSSITKVIPHFFQQFGRLRTVNIGPDGWLYISTSNTDGRGAPRDNDDKIMRLNPALFSS